MSPQPIKTEKGKESETVVQVKELEASQCQPSPADGPGVDVLHVGGAGHLHQEDNVPLPPPLVPLVSEDKRTDTAEKLTEEKDSCVPLVNQLQEQVAAEGDGSEEKEEEEEILLVVDEALDEEVEREEKL